MVDRMRDDFDGRMRESEKGGTENRPVGRIFGSRGRGFTPMHMRSPKSSDEETENDKNIGGQWGTTRSYSSNRKEETHRGSFQSQGSSRAIQGNRMRHETRSEGKRLNYKPTSHIEERSPEDLSEIFGNEISSGINFDKYDNIEVKVSGENAPRAIQSFEEAGLVSVLLKSIKMCKYVKPTPIQKHAIPIIMEERDMMACAQTGSGKTAAFLIPIINRLIVERAEINSFARGRACEPFAVIVSPTRELAIQIYNEARKFSVGTSITAALVYGGVATSKQLMSLRKGCHILVATPGRLIYFLNAKKIEFSEIKFVVLDEADKMLDMGFLPDMELIMSHPTMVPLKARQTVMFSATFPEEIQHLAGKFLNEYIFVAAGIVGGACSDVEQRFFSVTKFEKRNELVRLLNEEGSRRCLVFVGEKRTTDFIATYLCEKDFPATSIHGDREQNEREEALDDFKRGRMGVLVATSVCARGLDIKDVAHVINFDLPRTIDEYVHRIGRTGRVGNRGLATSFYDPNIDRGIASDLVKILKQANQPVPEFLRRDAVRSGSRRSTDFGGLDFRDQPCTSDMARARDFVFEDEKW